MKTNEIIYAFDELDMRALTDSELNQILAVTSNQQIDAESEMRRRRVQNKEPRFRDVTERIKQADATQVQEFNKGAERIAEMIRDADEREMW